MILLLLFAFLAGLVTILAPCIWPVLPIVLSSSIAGGKGHQRPLGITLGVMVSFTIFTLSVSYLVRIFHLDPNVLRLLAVIIIAFLGLTMIIPALAAQFELFVSRLSNIFGQNGKKTGSGFLPGFITGLSLGIVWSPCAGPILATIATLAATGQVSLQVILVTVAYVTGVGIPLFAFAYGGQQFIARAKGVNKYTGKIQQIFGVIMLLAALAIFTNYDQTLQLQLLNKFPALGTAVNGFENSTVVKNQLDVLKGKHSIQSADTSGLFNANTPAHDFVGVDTWLNTNNKPVTIASLKGKVVLVDFWTYTCINCIRTLPYVTSWYNKYKDDGFVVVGVHTPEFQFEHDTNNVKNAIKQYNIHYPVAQDNEYTTWNNYANEYWPAEYLIDANGVVRRTHFGEGEYDQMEMAIQALLKNTGKNITAKLDSMHDQTSPSEISPETYLGSKRMQYYFLNGTIGNGIQSFTLSDNLIKNSFSYGGVWTVSDEYATTGANATLSYNFTASKVFIILRPGQVKNPTMKVYFDGKIIDPSVAGSDVKNGIITIDNDRLYNVIDLHGKIESHILKLESQTPGVEAFTFTFG